MVGLVRASGKSAGQVARELELTETAVRAWVKQAAVDARHDLQGLLTSEERAELARLRRELKTVTMERDFLRNGPGHCGPSVKREPPVRVPRRLHGTDQLQRAGGRSRQLLLTRDVGRRCLALLVYGRKVGLRSARACAVAVSGALRMFGRQKQVLVRSVTISTDAMVVRTRCISTRSSKASAIRSSARSETDKSKRSWKRRSESQENR